MDFTETAEHRDLRAAVAQIAGSFGPKYYTARAAERRPCAELWTALGQAGFLGVNIPGQFGGGGGGLTELAIVCEELGAQGTPLLLLVVSAAISGEVIAEFGTDGQRKAWLPGLAAGTAKVVFAITEPDAGSNTHRLATTAVRDGGGWVLSGTKHYISGVDEAQALLVVARTGRDEGGNARLSLFLVPADAPGLQKRPLPVDILLPERQFTLTFDEVRLGPDALVGTEGDGFRQVFHGLNPERITGAALCIGIARHVLRVAARYAGERQVWSVPIGAHQGVSHPLARAKIETELAALMTRRAAWQHDHGEPAGEASNMAKYAAAEASIAACDAAIQAHGGNGVATEYGLLPYWGLARLLRIAPVNREMVLNYVAQHSLGLPRSYLQEKIMDETQRERTRRNLIQRVNVGDSLTRSAAARPGQLAVRDGERSWTYAELNAWVNRLAHGLSALGYRRGDALGIASGNSAEFLAFYYACAKTGVVAVPVNLGWRADEVAYVLGHSGARGLAVETQLVAAMTEAIGKVPAVTDVIVLPGLHADYEAAPAERHWLTAEELTAEELTAEELTGTDDTEPDRYVEDRDPLSYLYTSGTTSFPKGVVGTHLGIYLESMSAALDSGWHAGDRFAAMMPMFHTAQLNAFCTPAVLVGATIHVLRGFEPRKWLEMIERERITQVFGLPMMYQAALDHPAFSGRDVSSLRRAVYAMAPMPDELIRRCMAEFGCDFALLFGQTEMSPCTTLFRPEHQLSHIGAVGTPLTGVQVAIMGPGGELLPAGEQGEIVYRGPSTMAEYLKNPDATAEAFAHGWFHSGDVGRFGSDGVLWFADRYKDVIKTGGENVASIEVEKAVYAADPRIAEVVVVGLPHERWSEAITAVVVPKPGETIDPAALISELKDRLDGYKVPKSVIVADELPRTSTGKVQKNVVRDRYAAHYSAPRP